MSDREDIRDLAHAYAIHLSHRRYDEVCALFVDDVRVGAASGRAALRASFEAQMAPLGMVILSVTNQLVTEIDGDSASGIVGTRAELELDGQFVIQSIEYHDTYARRDGRWLFVRRKHHLWYGAPLGVNPLTLPPARWPASAIGMGDLDHHRQ